MIYAIDKLFTKRLINGWVSSKKNDIDETFKVTLYNPVKKVACVNANNNRPDVKQAGLHQTGLCGFSFDCEAYEIKDGDLLFVLIEGNVTKKTTTTSFIYGDAKRHVREYNSFELDRGDFSIMDYSTHQLFEKFNHLIALKAILIRLRRHKRGKGGRGKFVGVNYLHKNSDFKMFMSILSVFRETIFEHFSTRHLFSLTDTIADFGNEIDRLAALSISMIMFHERFAHSLNLIYDKTEKENIVFDRQISAWGGMATNRLESDDALDVYFTRAIEILQSSPLINSFFMEIAVRMMNEEKSIYNENVRKSPYFTKVWEYYQKYFNVTNKKVMSELKVTGGD